MIRIWSKAKGAEIERGIDFEDISEMERWNRTARSEREKESKIKQLSSLDLELTLRSLTKRKTSLEDEVMILALEVLCLYGTWGISGGKVL